MTLSEQVERKPRIFLSYARGDDEPFVRRLYDDLTAAGFTVWFDRESLLSRGVTFHQEIKDAIRTEVDRVIYIGGPQAALSPYVREEWQFALECDHLVVVPILRLGDYDQIPGELGLLHCEDFRDDDQYGIALAKLIINLRQPNPKLGALLAVPTLPPHFLARRELMCRVRDALLVDLQKPHVITSADARLGMQGMGGIGKSVLAAALARNRQVRQSYPDGIVWITCGQSLTADGRLSRLRDLVGLLGGDDTFQSVPQGQGRLRELLQAKAVLLVFDDVWQAGDAQTFDFLGPRCRMLVTTRDAGILHTLHGELIPVSLFTEVEALQLLADAVGVAPAALPAEAQEVVRECGLLPLALALSGGMAKKRGGDFHAVLERLRRAHLEKIADRESINEAHQSIWRAMQASVEMLSEEEQRRFAELAVFAPDETVPEPAMATLWAHTGHLDDLDTEDLLINLAERALIKVDQQPDAKGKRQLRVSLHDLLYDYATRIAGPPRTLHESLLAAYQQKCPGGWHEGPNDGYFLDHLRDHLIAAERGSELADLLYQLQWLEAKNAAGLVFDLLSDFQESQQVLPEKDYQRKILKLLEEALRREIHFIHQHLDDYPQALFQCLWNNCWWYDCAQGGPYYVNGQPPSNDPARPLSRMLENWLEQRKQSNPSSPWVRTLRPPSVHLGTTQLAVFRGHRHEVNSVNYSPDGTRIASGSADRTIRIWDAESGAELNILRGHENRVTSVCFSPDGARILSGATDKTVRVWDVESGVELATLRGHENGVTSVSYSPDGLRIVSCAGSYHDEDEDFTVRIWDAESGAELAVLRGHENEVTSVSLSPDGARIVSCSRESVRVWDASSGAQVAVLRGNELRPSSVSYSPDGTRITIGSSDNIVRVWNATNGDQRLITREHTEYVGRVSYFGDGSMIIIDSGVKLVIMRGHMKLITCVCYSFDSSRVVSGSADGTVRIWDAESGAELAVLRGHENEVTSVSHSPDKLCIVSGSSDGTVRVWDATSSVEMAVLPGHESYIISLKYSPDGSRIVSGSNDATVRVWDAKSGNALDVLNGHDSFILSVNYSPDKSQIVSGSGDNTVRVWDAENDAEPVVLRGHKGHVWSASFSPDGTRIVSGGSDNLVRVWDAASGAELVVLRGHEALVFSVTFSPDGTRIASVSADRTIRIWDAESGAEQNILRGHYNRVSSVCFSPDGSRIVSGDLETMRVSDSETLECLEIIQGYGDVVAIAAGAAVFPIRALVRDNETVFETASSATVIARHHYAQFLISTAPSDNTWAIVEGNHVQLITLEGLPNLPAAQKAARPMISDL